MVVQCQAMAQAVRRRSLTEKALVQSQDRPFGICGGKDGTGTVFSEHIGFPLSVPFQQCSIHIHSSFTDSHSLLRNKRIYITLSSYLTDNTVCYD